MNIPDSILAQSEARAGDPFVPSRIFIKKDPKEIYDFLRYNLNDEKLSKLLEQSFFYYKKEASTSKEIFSNTLSLIHDYALDKIKNSTMDEEKKYDVINLCRSYFKNLTSQVETFCDLMDFFNKNNNLLEPKEISIIILGYATGIFKKLYTN